MEEWRPVIGYPDYEVSNLGGLRTYLLLRNKQVLRLSEPRPVKPFKDYAAFSPRVWIWRDGGMHHVCLRPLVLEAFVGPPKSGDCKRTKHILGKRGGVSARLDEIAWSVDTPNHAARCADRSRKVRAIMRFRRRRNKPRTLKTCFRLEVIEAVKAGGAPYSVIARRLRISERQLRGRIYAACKRHQRKFGDPIYWLDPEIYGPESRRQVNHDCATIMGVIEAVKRGENYGDIARRFGFKGTRAKCVVAGIAFRARRRGLERKGDPALWLATPPRDTTEHRILAMAHARAQGRRLSIAQDALRRSGRFDSDIDPDRLAIADGGRSDVRKALPVG